MALDGDSCSNLTASYLGNKTFFEADKRMITLNCVLRPRLHVSNGRQPILPLVNIGFSSSCMGSFHQDQAIWSFIALAWGGHDRVHNVRTISCQTQTMPYYTSIHHATLYHIMPNPNYIILYFNAPRYTIQHLSTQYHSTRYHSILHNAPNSTNSPRTAAN